MRYLDEVVKLHKLTMYYALVIFFTEGRVTRVSYFRSVTDFIIDYISEPKRVDEREEHRGKCIVHIFNNRIRYNSCKKIRNK